ncbi:helix-turn-helix transcriptional regulator [Fructobacillus fructosus]|uniref:Contains XRE-family HTH domain (HipB) n=1 Tax=Fructobacillus fructosus TaxID=1631 RepID=A0ABN9YMP1_9LACO|nr:Transcriptional regulator [Fructobacillus fructosus]CAK1252229.1 Transcriptional regulator [Fructobacillus fructosus]
MDVKNRIKKIRQEQHKTLREVAEAVGTSNQNISNWERGKSEPKLSTWQKLADFFDVPVGYIQGISNIPNKHISDGYSFFQDIKEYGSSTDIESEEMKDIKLNQFNKLIDMFAYGDDWGIFDDVDINSRLAIVRSIDVSFANALDVFGEGKDYTGSIEQANKYMQQYSERLANYNPKWWDANDLNSPLSVEKDVYYKNILLTKKQRQQLTDLLNSFIPTKQKNPIVNKKASDD